MFGFDRDALHLAQMWQESRNDPNAVSPVGAMGLMQIMPATAKQPGFGMKPLSDPFNPKANEAFGRAYMDKMLHRYKGDAKRALAAYNWGVGNADKWDGNLSSLPKETRGYITKITADMKRRSTPQKMPALQPSQNVSAPPQIANAPPKPIDLISEQNRAEPMKTKGLFGAMSPDMRNILMAAGRSIADPDVSFAEAALSIQDRELQREMQQAQLEAIKQRQQNAQRQQEAQAKQAEANKQQSNMTAQWLASKGADPMIVQMAQAGHGKQAYDYWKQGQTPQNRQPASIQEFEYARQNGFDGSFVDWQNRGKFDSPNYGLSPIYGRDKDGNMVVMQPSSKGGLIQSELPEGVQPLGPYEKSLEQSKGRAVGKEQGEAETQLGGASLGVGQTIKKIDELLTDPDLSKVSGIESYIPDVIAGSVSGGKILDLRRRVDQLRGTAFLEAYNGLRGGGQITEVEGKKAENALARLDTAQSDEGYRQALIDFREAVQVGYQKLAAKAGQLNVPAPSQSDGWNDMGNGVRIRIKP